MMKDCKAMEKTLETLENSYDILTLKKTKQNAQFYKKA